jgi:hypothetical protein
MHPMTHVYATTHTTNSSSGEVAQQRDTEQAIAIWQIGTHVRAPGRLSASAGMSRAAVISDIPIVVAVRMREFP